MTTSDERVTAAIEAYLVFRSGGGQEPSFDDLSEEERREVEETIDVLRAAEGLEPSLSRPSLEHLLVNSEFADVFQHQQGDSEAGGFVERLATELGEMESTSFDPPVSDSSRGHVSCTVRSRGHRVCVLVLTDCSSWDEVQVEIALDLAGERLGRSPDLAAVLIAVNDDALSAAAIDVQDTVMCIDAPTGEMEGPMIRRSPLPLRQAIQSFFNEVAPAFDSIDVAIDGRSRISEAAEIIRRCARRAVDQIIQDGNRARVPAKKTAWSSFDETTATALEAFALQAREQQLSPEEMRERISALSEAA